MTSQEPTPNPSSTAVENSSSSTTTRAALRALWYDPSSRANTGAVPPISEWEAVLLGKKWIAEHRELDETTFKRSELPKPNRVNGFINDGMLYRNRLNVDCDRETGIVKRVHYG